MCYGENCAPQAAHFIKAQLAAHYDNAVACIKEHDNAKRTETQYRFSHALADFSFGKLSQQAKSGASSMFEVTFDRPQLDFICNHDLMLRFKIKNGHYHLDYNKPPKNSSDSGRLASLSDVEVNFRVSFDMRELSGKDSKIGNGRMSLVVLDLHTAKLISTTPDISVGQDALSFYLSKYLVFLQTAGYHVFFSLPEFHDRYRLTIDYSAFAGSQLTDVDEIHGISVERINMQLASAWLRAAMLSIDVSGNAVDWTTTTLAHYRGSLIVSEEHNSQTQFRVNFGAPRLQAVCAQEAILVFTLDEVLLYEGIDATLDEMPTKRYSGWKIAFLVGIIRENQADGSATRCRVDLSRCHLREDLCSLSDVEESSQYAEELLDSFVDYLTLLENTNQLIIYDSTWSTSTSISIHDDANETEDDFSSWDLETSTAGDVNNPFAAWQQTVTKSNTGGFDEVIALSQASINTHFKTLWTSSSSRTSVTSSLFSWASGQDFSAAFKPLRVRLLSNDRAIVWVHLEKGHLKLLRHGTPWNESNQHNFEEWQLAFEVKLQMASHANMEGVDSAWQAKSDFTSMKQHGNESDRILMHLFLDLRSAEYVHEYSRFDDLLQTQTSETIDKLHAILYYMRNRYFPALLTSGLNILHSVPVFSSLNKLYTYALTDVAFHVYSSTIIDRRNCVYVGDATEPAIVILGMTGSRPMPASRRLEYSANWCIRTGKGVSKSSITLSREVFVDRGLLAALARINAITTVIPLMSPVDENGVWKLRLTTWAKDELKRDQECQWQRETEGMKEGRLKFKWEHQVTFRYEHKGSGVVNGAYSVACATRNFVELPPASRKGPMTIKIWGEVVLNVSFGSNHGMGSAKSSAKWSASIVLNTNASGIKVSIEGSTAPVFEKTQYEGEFKEMFTDLQSDLEALLPAKVELHDILQETQQFEGEWRYCYPGIMAYCLANPFFNARGDLLFELQTHTAQQSTLSAVPAGLAPGVAQRSSRRGTRVYNMQSTTYQKQESTRTSSMRHTQSFSRPGTPVAVA